LSQGEGERRPKYQRYEVLVRVYRRNNIASVA
jgi:hypothetical protein